MDTQGALFDPPPPPAGSMVTAMRENLDQWRAAGQVVGPAQRAALLAQSEAVDLALSIRKATQVSGACRVLSEMLQQFGLVAAVPPAGGDAFDRLLSELQANDQPAGG